MVTESPVSTIQTVLDDTPHGWRLTPSFWMAVAVPTHRPLPTPPQDGVAAAAESIPTVLTPPITVSVAAAAKTLLLKPMESSLLGTTAVPCARLLLLARGGLASARPRGP